MPSPKRSSSLPCTVRSRTVPAHAKEKDQSGGPKGRISLLEGSSREKTIQGVEGNQRVSRVNG